MRERRCYFALERMKLISKRLGIFSIGVNIADTMDVIIEVTLMKKKIYYWLSDLLYFNTGPFLSESILY